MLSDTPENFGSEVGNSGFSRLAFKVEEAAAAARVSRTRIFQAIKSRSLPARKAGRATIILADDLRSWLKGLPPSVPEQREAVR